MCSNWTKGKPLNQAKKKQVVYDPSLEGRMKSTLWGFIISYKLQKENLDVQEANKTCVKVTLNQEGTCDFRNCLGTKAQLALSLRTSGFISMSVIS